MIKHNLSEAMSDADHENTHSLSIGTIVRLRWIAVVGQLFAVGFVAYVLGFDMPIGLCLAAIAISAWLNVYLSIAYSPSMRVGQVFATSMLAYDILQLAVLLFLTGGIENPFTTLFIAPVTVSAATLPLRNTIVLGLLTTVATGVLIYEHMPLPWFDGIRIPMPFLYKVGVFCSVTASTVFIALYAWRLAYDSRRIFAAKAAAELVLAREQKLHALDGLAAAAAHELGTPLSTITLVTKELERDKAFAATHRDDMKLLREQADRCQQILRKLTKKPSESDPMHASLSAREMLDEATTPYRNHGKAITVDAKASPAPDGHIAPEPVGVRQPGVIYGLGNLIENAVSYAKSEVQISARWDDEILSVEIMDDGPGFSQEILDQLGNPYITTRASGTARAKSDQGGLGLGFFIAKTLLERSGASFEFENRESPKTGAIIRVLWRLSRFTKAAE